MPIARDGAKVFPVTTHGFWKLQGPLAVEGGVTGADRSLQLGLKLPGEADGPLFKIGTQPPESKQIDVLNLFNDGSKQNRSGTMTSTTLSGLGLPKDLDFGPVYSSGNPQTFGEPAIFPGGIGYGTVQFVDGTFTTNGAKSTIEVVNLMLGIGNDSLDIQGTIDPDVPVKLTGTIEIELVTAGTAVTKAKIDLTRPQPFDWKAQGFLVGQPVKITGIPGEWVVIGFSDDDLTDTTDNTRMHLEQKVAATSPRRRSTRRRMRRQAAVGGVDHDRGRPRPAVDRPSRRRQLPRRRDRRRQARPDLGRRRLLHRGRHVRRRRRRQVRAAGARPRAGATLPAVDIVVTPPRNPLGGSDRHCRRRSGRADRSDHDRRWGVRRLRHPDRRAELGRLRLHGGPAGPDPGPRRCVAPPPDRRPDWQRAAARAGPCTPDDRSSPRPGWSTGPARTAASPSSTVAATAS